MTKLTRIIKIFCLVCLFVSCSALLNKRSFNDVMEHEDATLFGAGKDFPVVPGDTGEVRMSDAELMARTPASRLQKEDQEQNLSLQRELIELESKLSEWDQIEYRRIEPEIGSVSEKIYFLKLSADEKNRYLRLMGHKEIRNQEPYQENWPTLRNYTKTRSDIYLGMEKNEVTQRWGRPEKVEIAGNPGLQNEKWTFYVEGIVKHIYFEGGKVQGWVQE